MATQLSRMTTSSSPASLNVQAPNLIFFKELKNLGVVELDTISANLQTGLHYLFYTPAI